MKIYYILLLLSFLSLYSCQSLGLFQEQFLKEINKFKPNITDYELDNAINDFIKTNKITKNYSIKTVNLSNVMANCNLDFEIKLVQSSVLPASNHLIAHVNIGGALQHKDEKPKYINYEACQIGVVIKGNEPKTVYSLLYDITFEFNRAAFNEVYNLNITYDEQRDIIDYIFYNIAYNIFIFDIFPITVKRKCIMQPELNEI